MDDEIAYARKLVAEKQRELREAEEYLKRLAPTANDQVEKLAAHIRKTFPHLMEGDYISERNASVLLGKKKKKAVASMRERRTGPKPSWVNRMWQYHVLDFARYCIETGAHLVSPGLTFPA